ncbi:hypothetical protein ACGF0J_37000 [Nonomuraea sp. NPDC047897]
MTTTVELTRFRASPEHTDRLPAARPAMLADFRAVSADAGTTQEGEN